jgi:hypothetical protein
MTSDPGCKSRMSAWVGIVKSLPDGRHAVEHARRQRPDLPACEEQCERSTGLGAGGSVQEARCWSWSEAARRFCRF